ncbi:MAG: efflux RND transporter permease subunit [Lentisphaerae bacterium]|nr:efflux RND transporter permease subunit [Lentisphaerota bacterium]
MEGVKEIRSTSAENVTSLVVEFFAGEDIEQSRQRVKDKVDLAKPDLPEDLDEPVVDAFNFSSDFPVYIFALSGETDLDRLKNLAEDLQDRIERLPGIKSADIAGTREREIRVEIDLPRMIAYRIPLGLVMGRIAQENVTVSAGNIEVAGDKFQVRIPGEFELVGELRGILLAERNGRPVYLTDIASVEDTFKDLDSISRLNGEPCVSVQLKKRVGINSVKLIAEVEGILAEAGLPPDVTLTEVMDQSTYIDQMIQELENSVASGFLLVVVVLLVFLGVRNAVFVGLAIPFSMLTAFTLMAVRGTTLNMIVLFSLVLAVGMLVDNAIVIVENIYRLRTEGLTRTDEALRAIEAKIARHPDVKFFLTSVGGQSSGMLYGGASASHQGGIHVEFKDAADRLTNSLLVVDAIRADVGVIPGAEVKVEKTEEGPPTGAPVSIEISGDDFDVLEQIAADVQRAIETVPGLVDLQSDLEKALPEIQFHVDRARAVLLGLDTAEIGNFLRMAIYGIESSRLRADEDEYGITLRLPLSQRQTMNLLDEVFIPTPAGAAVPLSSLGRLEYTGGRGAIQRKQQKRVVTLTGNNQGRGSTRSWPTCRSAWRTSCCRAATRSSTRATPRRCANRECS